MGGREAVSAWFAMDSAPKDGSVIRLLEDNGRWTCAARWVNGEWEYLERWVKLKNPKAWMPLPPLPEIRVRP